MEMLLTCLTLALRLQLSNDWKKTDIVNVNRKKNSQRKCKKKKDREIDLFKCSWKGVWLNSDEKDR